MKTRRYLIGLIFFALVGSCPAATRSDQAKEKRWEEQIVPSLMVGEAVNLRANGTEFLGLYAPNTGEPSYGGVILIHGTGAHPAWPQIIEPLRIALPEHGWSTLSLQMPILANDAKQQAYLPLMPEAPLRIQAGVDFLKGKGVNNIVLIAHSMGATMANMYLADKPDPAVHGYIAIGMSNEFPKRYDNIMALGKITLPMLSLYGSEDLEATPAFVKSSAVAARKVNQHFSQVFVKGADHFFTDKSNILVNRVSGWLMKNASGKASSRP